MSRLVVRERLFSFTGKYFDVKAGFFTKPIFEVEGDHSSFHDRRKLYDDDGRKVFELKTKILSARQHMRIKDASNNQVVATLRRATYVPIAVRREGEIHVWKGEDTKASPWFEINGDKGGDRFPVLDMWRGGREVAVVYKKSFTIPTFFGKSSYILEIERGYSEPLMIMLTIAIDTFYSD